MQFKQWLESEGGVRQPIGNRNDSISPRYEQPIINKTMYHGTFSRFENFEFKKGLGIHFGTLAQSKMIINMWLRSKTKKPTTAPILYEVSVTISHPLRLSDCAWHDPFMVQDILISHGVMRRDDKISHYTSNSLGSFFESIRNIIKDAGFDGIVYKNVKENDGDDSCIILEPSQAKIIKEIPLDIKYSDRRPKIITKWRVKPL